MFWLKGRKLIDKSFGSFCMFTPKYSMNFETHSNLNITKSLKGLYLKQRIALKPVWPKLVICGKRFYNPGLKHLQVCSLFKNLTKGGLQNRDQWFFVTLYQYHSVGNQSGPRALFELINSYIWVYFQEMCVFYIFISIFETVKIMNLPLWVLSHLSQSLFLAYNW